MQLAAFAELVRRMRHAQRRYFETRAHSYLLESKRLEKEVDDAVWDFKQPALLPELERTDGRTQ